MCGRSQFLRVPEIIEAYGPAQVGDVVTFFLKYSNHGGQPITNVAVSDSLTGRLEYVIGSARADHTMIAWPAHMHSRSTELWIAVLTSAAFRSSRVA